MPFVEVTEMCLAPVRGRAHAPGVLRTSLVAALALTLAAAEASAECRSAPAAESFGFTGDAVTVTAEEAEAVGPSLSDRAGRIVAPVLVNGQGPFRFIVDTGANRSVLSPGLATELGLRPGGHGAVHSVHGVANAPLVRVDSLQYGGLPLSQGDVPVLSGPVLAGEHGLLGVDGMVGRMLLLDFERNCIEILPSRNSARLRGRGWTVLPGELRFGHLIVVPGVIDGVDVNVLIDTGSDTSLANTALREAVRARRIARGRGRAVTVNEPIMLSHSIIIEQIDIAGLEVQNVTAFIGDFHIFNLWGLLDEPTILLGMDVISQADAMAIDYGRQTLHFRVGHRRPNPIPVSSPRSPRR